MDKGMENNEDIELQEFERSLDERANVEEAKVNGARIQIIHENFGSRHLYEIEKFVNDIRDKGRKGGFYEYQTRYGKVWKIEDIYLAKKHYKNVSKWLRRYSEKYKYTLRVELFYDVCGEMGLIGKDDAWFDEPEVIDARTGLRYMDLFNELIERVRRYSFSREQKERDRLRLKNAKDNERNVLAMENLMFDKEMGKSRWLVLSLTLRYKAAYRRWITPQILQKHRDRLLQARRYNKLLKGIENYAWTIEEGEKTGLHLHVIIYYSAESNRDAIIAMQIGEYWENVVTEGKGDYWNSNSSGRKEHYARYGHGVGVGQINWNDAGKRKALRKNLIYLAKTEQYLMSRRMDGIHTFGMGQVPKKIKSGRPRTELLS